jgi:hypothetical protein
MLVYDVPVEYELRQYHLPLLVVGSVRSKLRHRGLSERLEAAMMGTIQLVVLDGSAAKAFYLAARNIFVPADIEDDWEELMTALGAKHEPPPPLENLPALQVEA